MNLTAADTPGPAPVLDEARLTELRDILGDVLEEVLRAWLRDAPLSLAAARHGFTEARLDDALAAVHTLKGSSGNVGAARLAAASRRLEQAVHNGLLDGRAALNVLAQLDAEYDNAARLITARLQS